MKKLLFFLITGLLFAAQAQALVFEQNSAGAEEIAKGIPAFLLNSMKTRINGKNAGLKRYASKEPVKKVLEAYLFKAEKDGSRLVNNRYLWFAANAIFLGAGSGFETGSFGYIYMEDKKGGVVFVVAGGAGGYTEIIKAEIRGKAGRGFDDGISHAAGTEKMLSIEFLSGGKTLNFGNFYRIKGALRHELRNYYEGEFMKNGIVVLKKQYTKESDIYMLKGKKSEMVFNIAGQDENGELAIFIMG